MSSRVNILVAAAFSLVAGLTLTAAPAYAVPDCSKCVNPGSSGVSRCFLCQTYKQGKATFHKHPTCTSAYCRYTGAPAPTPGSKRFR